MRNYVNGDWVASSAADSLPVLNPATGEELGTTPLSTATDVGQAVDAASRAFPAWRRMPVTDRVQFLFKLKALLENATSTRSPARSRSSAARRSPNRAARCVAPIENVEVACGTPILIQGYNSEDIAAGIDEIMIRQPLGVCAIIAPFNFPGMIPFWFLPYAIACGNTVVIKPSERVPLTMQKVFELLERDRPAAGRRQPGERRPGRRRTRLLDHPAVRAVSFVGSSAVARHVYARAAAAGKRVQCQGGAKNPVVVLPDADLGVGRRGHRRQRVRLRRPALPRHVARHHGGRRARAVSRRDSATGAQSRVVGYGLDEGVQMGPVISPESRARISRRSIRRSREGARAAGRRPTTRRAQLSKRQLRAADGPRRPAVLERAARRRRSSVPCCRCITSTTSTRRSRS